MKFWQKTYLFTLILVLLCQGGGIFALARYTYGGMTNAEENACRAQFVYLSRLLEAALEGVDPAEGEEQYLWQNLDVFGKHYGKSGIRLAVYAGEKPVYSSFPSDVPYQRDTFLQTYLGGVRYFLAEGPLEEAPYRVVLGKDISNLDDTFRSLTRTFLLISALVSLLLAVSLYWLLKRLTTPLGALQETAEAIAGGELSLRAKETGGDEFAKLAKSFNDMVEKLREEAEAKQMLVDNMAHELRTPLTGIKGYGDFLLRAAASEEVKLEAARCIVAEAERLEKISRTLLDTAYLRAEGITLQAVEADVLLGETAERFGERGVEIALEASPCPVLGDPLLLSLLFDNLTDNAVKSGATRVTLSCREGEVSVTDDGRGMTVEQLAHITRPFYRTDKSRSRGEGGTGLGLALCKQIALCHGAKLSFTSAPGEGTAVRVAFERRQEK
ncbi:MAG: HAMP domain-containing histidine kinase [Clostridia bacterium]|nr:HAMP domain-containing histidine kinase [Clostridia bacterium]